MTLLASPLHFLQQSVETALRLQEELSVLGLIFADGGCAVAAFPLRHASAPTAADDGDACGAFLNAAVDDAAVPWRPPSSGRREADVTMAAVPAPLARCEAEAAPLSIKRCRSFAADVSSPPGFSGGLHVKRGRRNRRRRRRRRRPSRGSDLRNRTTAMVRNLSVIWEVAE